MSSWCRFWIRDNSETFREVSEWLAEHATARYKMYGLVGYPQWWGYRLIKIKSDHDATLFMLRWSHVVNFEIDAARNSYKIAVRQIAKAEAEWMHVNSAGENTKRPHFVMTSKRIRRCTYCARRFSRNHIHKHIIDVHGINPFEGHAGEPHTGAGMTRDSINFYLGRDNHGMRIEKVKIQSFMRIGRGNGRAISLVA